MTRIVKTGTILDQIVESKLQRLAERENQVKTAELAELAKDCTQPVVDFSTRLFKQGMLALIGEIKKASPSKGIIQVDFNPTVQAAAYEQAHIAAISVLTEEDYFLGSDEILKQVRQTVGLPILRKDFTLCDRQIYEARLMGASAVLLICAILPDDQLIYLLQLTHDLGLKALVEVHDLNELMRALSAGAEIIGINNRDLHSFHVDLTVTERLAGLIPAGKIVVSESGIQNAKDMARVYRAGAHAVLIGESLMRAAGTSQTVWQRIQDLYREIPPNGSFQDLAEHAADLGGTLHPCDCPVGQVQS